MKRISILVFLFGVICLPLESTAGPFLSCDPYPTTAWQPTEFKITYGAVTVISPAETMADGSKRLSWDLGQLAPGVYNLNVSAVKTDPIWGNVESTPVPFSFTKPAPGATPPSPAGIKLLK